MNIISKTMIIEKHIAAFVAIQHFKQDIPQFWQDLFFSIKGLFPKWEKTSRPGSRLRDKVKKFFKEEHKEHLWTSFINGTSNESKLLKFQNCAKAKVLEFITENPEKEQLLDFLSVQLKVKKLEEDTRKRKQEIEDDIIKPDELEINSIQVSKKQQFIPNDSNMFKNHVKNEIEAWSKFESLNFHYLLSYLHEFQSIWLYIPFEDEDPTLNHKYYYKSFELDVRSPMKVHIFPIEGEKATTKQLFVVRELVKTDLYFPKIKSFFELFGEFKNTIKLCIKKC